MFILNKLHSKTKKIKKAFILLLCLLLILSAPVCILERRLGKIRDGLSEISAQDYASDAIVKGVEEVTDEEKITYDDIVKIIRDKSGTINSITTDAKLMNRISAEVNKKVGNLLEDVETYSMKIPISTVLGEQIIAGSGPSIRMNVTLTGMANTDFDSTLISAGINQTRHRIMLNVVAIVSVIFANSVKTYNVDYQVCLAESIVVGITPSAFAKVAY